MTGSEIMRVAAGMGYASCYSIRPTPSAHAQADYVSYVCLWIGGKQRFLGNVTKLAQLSEEELRRRIENKVTSVEDKVEQGIIASDADSIQGRR